jgi:hypothetical protein
VMVVAVVAMMVDDHKVKISTGFCVFVRGFGGWAGGGVWGVAGVIEGRGGCLGWFCA